MSELIKWPTLATMKARKKNIVILCFGFIIYQFLTDFIMRYVEDT